MKKFLFTFFLFVVIMVCMPVAALADDVGSLSSPIDLSTIPDFFAVDSGDTAYVTTPAGVTVKNKSIRVYEGATLVLCDADISYIEKGWRQGAAITMYDNSSLKLVGTNNVTASQGTSSYTYAIVAGSSVTISDYEADSTVGELVIDTTPYDSVYGIYIYFGSLTLESGIINVNSGYGGIAGANSSTLTVNGGVITANGGVGPMGGSIGIQSETIIINGGIVTGNGGDYPGGGGGNGIGGKSVTINGGSIIANGGNGYYGSYGISSRTLGINISGGVVAANGSKGGIYGKGTISGGEVTATGLNGLYTRGDTFNITGGEITLIGTNGGVYSEYDGAALNISDGAVVYIEGGISDFSSTYIPYDDSYITISGEDTIVLTKDSTGVIDSEFHMTLNDSIAFTNDTTQINNTLLNTFGNSSPYSNAGGLYYAGNVEFVTYNIGAHGSTNDVTYESVETNGSPNAVPDVIVDDGYGLKGWYKDSDTTLITDLSTQIITANTLFTAQYDFLYTVNYAEGSYGSIADNEESEDVINNNSPQNVPTATPNSGYTFAGWYKDSDTTLLSSLDVSNEVITAHTTFSAQYDDINVTDIELASETLTLIIGDTDTLGYVISPSDALNQDVTWSSSNTTVATVDNLGNITTLAVGNSLITVYTVDGGISDTCTLTVIRQPDSPQNVTATEGNEEITLNWTAPSFDGGSAITEYEVSSDNGITWVIASSDTAHTFTGLTNGTEYICSVRAVNIAGSGAEASIAATPRTVPGMPLNFTVTEDNEQLTLNWTAPSDDGGSAITGYEVSSDNGITWVNALSDTAHTFTGLTNGTEYICSVRAVNIAGSGAEASIAATPRTVPSMPLNFIVAEDNEQLTLNWTAPSSDGGSAITEYEVSSDNGITWVIASSDTAHTFTGLTNGTEYICSVRAVNIAGSGAEASIAATPRTVPGMPLNFTVTEGDEQLTFNWTSPSDDGGSAIIRYEVCNDDGVTWVVASSDTSHTFTGLNNGDYHYCSVRAVNEAGYGAESMPVAATPHTVPSMPLNFTVAEDNEQLTLNWTAPSSDGGSAITEYEVSSDNGITWVIASSDTAHTFTGLTNGTEYICSVRAVNIAGSGEAAGSILGKPYETRVVDTVDIINMRNPNASVITIEGADLLLASLVEFSVNGNAISLDTANPSRYTFDGGYIEQGSIVITMTPDYINSLPMGANYITLSLNNEGLFIYKEFNVVNQAINPRTGDGSINMWIYLLIPLLSALAIVLASKIRKKYLAG